MNSTKKFWRRWLVAKKVIHIIYKKIMYVAYLNNEKTSIPLLSKGLFLRNTFFDLIEISSNGLFVVVLKNNAEEKGFFSWLIFFLS